MLTVIFLCTVLLYLTIGAGGVYKRFHLTLLESALLSNLALFAALSLYLISTNTSQNVAIYVMVGSFSFGFLVAVGIQLFVIAQSLLKGKCHNRNGYEIVESFEEEEEAD